ncbi:AAA family ATPase [Polymorphospora sp. NPDC051019]|uniref:chloramphenicol phosphotransferase CPT family protein n=1 Tax=Polymorphospora sp. NPDC051019 TaxID=3155725 RepID=UPI003425A7E7
MSPPGQIVLLNGTSSAGKTSLAGQLLTVLDGPRFRRPYFHLSVDAFGAMRAARRTTDLSPAEVTDVLTRTRAGFHRAVAGMARAGNDVVADHVLSEPWRLRDCLEVMAGLDVVLVGVHCSAEELARRERVRGDRRIGQAAAQVERVHAHGVYDVECDTTTTTPYDCAVRIRDFLLARPPGPTAFDRLRAAAAGRPYGR